MSFKRAITLLLALVGLCASAAQAQERTIRERAEASFKAGAAAYAAGEYLAAIQALEAAYELTPLPAIAFSLAQAERRQYFVSHELPHLERAIALYRSYVEQVVSGGRRADALDALSQLEPLAAVHGLGAPAPSAAATGVVQPTRLMITSEAPNARISLDGSAPAPSPLIREVEPGKHMAVVEADGFFPARRELTALRGELILGEIPLAERPSTLQVEAPEGAELYVDGTFAGQGGTRVALQLGSGPHRLAVVAKGSRIAYRSLQLERGQTHTLRVTLEQTRQRKAAIGLFVAGGAVMATGIVLGGLAIGEEERAQDFLDQQARGNVSMQQLNRYHAHVDDRDLYRSLAIASLGAAAGLWVTALLLRELDRPNAQDIQREPRTLPAARGEAPSSLSSRVRVSPWFTRGVLGGALEQRF